MKVSRLLSVDAGYGRKPEASPLTGSGLATVSVRGSTGDLTAFQQRVHRHHADLAAKDQPRPDEIHLAIELWVGATPQQFVLLLRLPGEKRSAGRMAVSLSDATPRGVRAPHPEAPADSDNNGTVPGARPSWGRDQDHLVNQALDLNRS